MKQNYVVMTLSASLPDEVVQAMVENYVRALGEFCKENWQYFGNEIGQFIECARRLIGFKIRRYIYQTGK